MHEKLVIVFQIVEYRNGAIFKTKKIGPKWVEIYEEPEQGFLYISPNEKEIKENDPKGIGFRRKLRSEEVEIKHN